jgi:Beta-galactosidase
VIGLRLRRSARPLTDRWRHVAVEPRGSTELGVSFRPLQAEALGLDAADALHRLLPHPFEVVRLGAYWNRMEPAPGAFLPDELDRQVEACERAGKRIVLCVGPVKTFGYPECFVPDHHLPRPFREGALVRPEDHAPLLAAATAFATRVVERYRDRSAIAAWQVEHEAVDPLGVEHSWRLSAAFVEREVAAVRAADPARPIVMNGFLPTTLPARAVQRWRTRDQGDSLAVAARLADVVGVDLYPRYALAGVGGASLYLDGAGARPAPTAGRLMVTEGQAEPWEAVTIPPNPSGLAMASCLPEHVIETYNRCLRWRPPPEAYLFWGAEYWLARERAGDPSYLAAFERVLELSSV